MNNPNYSYSSPLKFLNHYQQEDKDFFFGRTKEINEVFRLFKRTNLVVLFGPSGSGKSSVAQCGLTNRFYDWKSFTIRKNSDFVSSFFDIIEKEQLFSEDSCRKLKTKFDALTSLLFKTDRTDAEFDSGKFEKEKGEQLFAIEEEINALHSELAHTPFFIFDQFEELFIEGSAQEIDEFSLLLSVITSKVAFSNVVICIQTEFFANLLLLESFNPNILNYKCSVNDPGKENVVEILEGTFKYFNINQLKVPGNPLERKGEPLERKEQLKRIHQIIDKITGIDNQIHLPFLQIYLDKLYVADFGQSTYPEQKELLLHPKDIKFDEMPIEFEKHEINAHGKIKKILGVYIREINDALIEHKGNKIEGRKHRDTVIKFLKHFVTEKSTKRPVEILSTDSASIDYLKIKGDLKNAIKKDIWSKEEEEIDASLVEISSELLNARILKLNGNFLELSHNLLARIIKNFPVYRDTTYYNRVDFNSAYDRYAKERLNGAKKPPLLSTYLVKKMRVGNEIDYVIREGSEMETEKRKFWNKSESRFINRRRTFFSGIVVGIFGLFVGVMYILNIFEVLEFNRGGFKAEAKKNDVVKEIMAGVSSALETGENDLTKSYLQLVGTDIDTTSIKAESIQNSLRLYNRVKENLISNYVNQPFYLDELKLPYQTERHILTTKSRVIDSINKQILLCAQTKKNLYTKIISLGASKEVNEWHSLLDEGELTNTNALTSFEPYEFDDEIRVIYSDSQGTFDTDYTFSNPSQISSSQKKIGLLEHIRNRGNHRVFVGVEDNTMIYKFSISKEEKKIGSVKRGVTSYLLKDEDNAEFKSFSLGKSPIRSVKKASENDICFLVNINDSVPYLYRIDVDEREPKDELDLRKLRTGLQMDDIDAWNLDKENRVILIATQKMVYTVPLDNFNQRTTVSNLKINSHHQAKINSIDSFEDYTIIGSDDKTASVYFDENPEKEGDEILTKILVGHTDALHNVSIKKIGDKTYGITSGEDGTVKLWDLSPMEEAQLYVKDAMEPISIRYRKNEQKLYAGFALNKNVRKGYLLAIDSTLSYNFDSILIDQYPRRSYLTTFDFDQKNRLYVGTFWNGFISSLDGSLKSFRPVSDQIPIRINAIEIKDKQLAVASSKGLFYYTDFTVSADSPTVQANGTSGIRFNSVDFHPQRELILATSDNGKVYLWNPKTNDLEWYGDHYDRVRDAHFSKDGNFFVSASFDNTAIVWYLKSSRKNDMKVGHKNGNLYNHFRRLSDHNSDVEAIAISENNIVATGSSDKTVLLYQINEIIDDSLKTLEILKKPSIIRHDYGVRSISFGGKSNIIYTADRKGYIKKWDTGTFEEKIGNRTMTDSILK